MEKNNSNESFHLISENAAQASDDLLQLVKKNKCIPAFLNKVAPNDPKLRRLKKAIHKGNFRARIWNNADCNLYLIYLIQKKMIPFWQGITAYVYLIAKMQYTTTQNLRAEDHDVKLSYQVTIVPLVKAGKITELGYQYLLGLVYDLEHLNFNLNFSQLASYVVALPRIEQWLIKTEFDHHTRQFDFRRDSNRLVWVLSHNLPVMQKLSLEREEDLTMAYMVPSSSVINYCLYAMNEQPMRMRPVFGSLGLKTLYNWHAQDFHPVSLYATQIISNPKDADGYRCGPFALWLHDIGHAFWASMLSKSQRDYIFTTYIPALRRLKEIAEQYGDRVSVEFLEEVEGKAYDFDLTTIHDYRDKTTRLETYLAHTMGRNSAHPSCVYTRACEFEAIGRAQGDRVYFLLHYCLYDPKVSESGKAVYKTLINFISTGENYRNQRIVGALQTLAKNATLNPQALFAQGPPPEHKGTALNWQLLLHSGLSSEKLWIEITEDNDLADDLLGMIEQGLNFFHPYLPMTPVKKGIWLDFLMKEKDEKRSVCTFSYPTLRAKFQPRLFTLQEKDESVFPLTMANHYKV